MHGHPPHGFDLRALAFQIMCDAGFAPDFSPGDESQVEQLRRDPPALPEKDLRDRLWSSIDNDDSQDLDQIEVVEELPGGMRVMVGVADVDACVPAGSSVDRRAAQNTTSVYTGVRTFPMLPDGLSFDLTSLVQDEDRAAVVIDMEIDSDGGVAKSDIYRAVVRNHAKLTYRAVGAWLQGDGPMPDAIRAVPGMERQLRMQDRLAHVLSARREREGMLQFESIETRPVMHDARVVDLEAVDKTRANAIIENLMIAANTSMATTLQERGIPMIERVVRIPERWPRIVEIASRLGAQLPGEPDAGALSAFLAERRRLDPERFPDLSLSIVKLLGAGEYDLNEGGERPLGHFGLALYRYTHSTAPNRRYPDMIIQRLVKAVIAGKRSPYTPDELRDIAAHCTERESAARKVERTIRKAAAAVWLGDRVGQVFDGIVTGAKSSGTYVRILKPPVEGRVVRGEAGMDVGDRVRVRLIGTDPRRGFIDFQGIG